jgi:transporter family protein
MIESWKLFALGSAGFAALTAIFGKVGVSNLDSHFATFVRTVVILVFTTGLLCFTDFKFSSIKGTHARQWGFLVISGICTGASWLCYYRALKLGPASKVAPIDKMSVALSILLAWIFLGEKMTWSLALGAVLILSGTLVILL